MTGHRFKTIFAAMILIGLTSPPAVSSKIAVPLPGQNIVNVNVSLNMQFPIADGDADSLNTAQVDGRKILYRLATSECPILLQTIAATCGLTSLNVSTQIRRQNNQVPVILHLNGSARFAITLKDTDAPEQ